MPLKLCNLQVHNHHLAIERYHQHSDLILDNPKIEAVPSLFFQYSWECDMCAHWPVCRLATAWTQGRAPCPCQAVLWRTGEYLWRARYSLRRLGRSTVGRWMCRHTQQPSYTVETVPLGWRLGDWSASKWSYSSEPLSETDLANTEPPLSVSSRCWVRWIISGHDRSWTKDSWGLYFFLCLSLWMKNSLKDVIYVIGFVE